MFRLLLLSVLSWKYFSEQKMEFISGLLGHFIKKTFLRYLASWYTHIAIHYIYMHFIKYMFEHIVHFNYSHVVPHAVVQTSNSSNGIYFIWTISFKLFHLNYFFVHLNYFYVHLNYFYVHLNYFYVHLNYIFMFIWTIFLLIWTIFVCICYLINCMVPNLIIIKKFKNWIGRKIVQMSK